MLHHQAEAGVSSREFSKRSTYQTLCLSGEEGPCNLGSSDHLQLKKKKTKGGCILRLQMLELPHLNNQCWLLQMKLAMAKSIMLHSRWLRSLLGPTHIIQREGCIQFNNQAGFFLGYFCLFLKLISSFDWTILYRINGSFQKSHYRLWFSPSLILLPLKSKSSLGLSLLARQQIIAVLWTVFACLFIGSSLDFLIGCTCERFAQAAKSLPGKQFLTTLLNYDLWDVLPELWILVCWLTKCFHEMKDSCWESSWCSFSLGRDC